MKSLEKGEEKIQKICDVLRRETLEPAQLEAEGVIEQAKEKAAGIVREAEQNAEKIVEDARKSIEQERNVFHSSLEQAATQSLESLRQSIEHKLFNSEIESEIKQKSSDPNVIARLIDSIIKAIDEEGVSVDLSAVIPQVVSADEVNRLLGEKVLKRLKEQSVVVGHFDGGAQIKIHDKKMTIDITDSAIKELLSSYVRKDFRELLFGASKSKEV